LNIYDLIAYTVLLIIIGLIYMYSRSKYLELKRNLKGLIEKTEYIYKYLFESREKTWIKRIRKRYIVFAILSEKRFDKKVLEKTIRDYWVKYLGSIMLTRADPQIIYYEPSINRGVLRVAHKYKYHAIALLGFIREINGSKCLVIPLKTTGTLKKARQILYSLRRDLQK
jgi:ribonuclease P/MRP protein subunit POP5